MSDDRVRVLAEETALGVRELTDRVDRLEEALAELRALVTSGGDPR